MLVKHARKDEGPLTIDSQFFAALEHVISETQKMGRGLIREQFGVSEKELARLESGGEIRHNSRNFDNDMQAKIYIGYYSAPSFALTFSSGTSIETTEMSQVMLVLDAEPSTPKTFEATIGRYGSLHVKVSIGDFLAKGVRYDVQGGEANVNHLRSLLDRMIENAGPSNVFIYTPWPGLMLALAVWLISCAAIILAIIQIGRSGNSLVLQVGIILFIPLTVALGFISAAVAEKFRAMFPRLEFAYGVARRRQVARRALWLWIAGSILVPILLAVVTLLM